MNNLILTVIFVLSFPFAALAQDGENSDRFRATDLPLPRFVSLHADKVHARTGPGIRYPVRWTYVRKGLPVEIVREFEAWRKIRDRDGGEGWVHRSLISGYRTVMATGDENTGMHKDASGQSPVIARVEPGAILDVEECEGGWCRISSQGFEGWVSRKFLWGIYENEELN